MSGTTTPLLSDPSILHPMAGNVSNFDLQEILHQLSSFSAPLHHIVPDSYDESVGNLSEAQHWIFTNEVYQTWLTSSGGTILNLYGLQGSGKTSISKAIYHSLKLQEVPLAYASCQTNDGLSIPISKIFAVLLQQILSQRPRYLLCLPVQSISRGIDAESLSEQSLYEYFRTILASQPSELGETALAIIIDGFDSCELEYPILKDMIAAAALGSPSTVRIFATSDKPIPELSHFASIDLSKQLGMLDDIQHMVNQEIFSMIKQGRLAEELQGEIVRTLFSRVEGNEVLVVKLLLQEMEYSRVPSTSALIFEQVKTLPCSIDQLLLFRLERIPKPCRKWSAKVLYWLLLAVKPMTLEELRIALALSIKREPGSSTSLVVKERLSLSLKDDIDFILGGLVQTTGSYVSLIHHALGRYLIVKDQSKNLGEETNIPRNLKHISSPPSDPSGMELNVHTPTGANEPSRGYWNEALLPDNTSSIDSDSESARSEQEASDHQSEALKWTSPMDLSPCQPSRWNVSEWYKIKDIREAHKEIAQLCVSFLAIDGKGNLDQGVHFPYNWNYALATWTEHFHKGVPKAEVSFKHSRDRRSPVCLFLAAIQLGCNDAVQQLLELTAIKEAIREEPQKYGILHLAASCGYEEVVKVLLRSNPLGRDEMNTNGQYPLHSASIKGHEAVVKLLLNENTAADLNKQNRDGYIPLQLAAMYGNEGVVRELIEIGKAHLSANRTYKHALSSVLPDQPDSDNDSDDDLSSSSSSSSDSFNIMGHSNRQPPPLHLAAKGGHSRIVRLLVELNKENINVTFGEEGTPLHCAVVSQKPEVVETLIDLDADLDKKRFSGWSALHLACQKRLTIIIKQLIDAGANINLQTSNGSPPLSVAAQEGHLEGVQLLLDAGANPNQCNKKGVSPLYRAIFRQSIECVNALLDAGADPFKEIEVLHIPTPYKLALDQGKDIADALKKHTQGLLINSAKSGDVPGVKRLLKHEVDINGQDEYGRTALFWASVNRHQEIIKVLHEYKAEYMIADKDNLTCFDVATLNPTTLILLRNLFLGLSEDTLVEDGGEYRCKYLEQSAGGYLSLRCNICGQAPIDGYFFHCCTCGCTPGSQFNGYDICEGCDKEGLFCCKKHHRPKYFKGICRATGYFYTDIVAIWRSYDWESGRQSSYLYPMVRTQGVTGGGPEAVRCAKEEGQEATREEGQEATREEGQEATRKGGQDTMREESEVRKETKVEAT